MTRKQKRLSVIPGAMAFLAAAAALTFYALGQKASFFYMPAELEDCDTAARPAHPPRRTRRGRHGRARPRRQGDLCRHRRQNRSRSPTPASFPICSARGRGSSPKAVWHGRRVRRRQRARQARRELHAEGSRRRLKKKGVWQDRQECATAGSAAPSVQRAASIASALRDPLIVEIGHFALVLALALALVQSTVPLIGARTATGG